MKITAMLAMVSILGMSAQAAQASEVVTVYLASNAMVTPMILCQTRNLTSEMFARAGVEIEWRNGRPRDSASWEKRTVVVHLEDRTPRDRRPGALGFARPYEGVNSTVFYHRVDQLATRNEAPTLLAFVMVHEITHLLQRRSRHSESGIMKANWATSDYYQMARNPFTD
jgi:hypothetical protein